MDMKMTTRKRKYSTTWILMLTLRKEQIFISQEANIVSSILKILITQLIKTLIGMKRFFL